MEDFPSLVSLDTFEHTLTIFKDLAKKHDLKEILSHEAITKAVNNIWDAGIFINNWNFKLLRPLNVPKILFRVNVLTDFLFFMLLSLMMLTGMCVKARAQYIKIVASDLRRQKL